MASEYPEYATSVTDAAEIGDYTRLSEPGAASRQFIDDLDAANRFKNFLIGRGIEVPGSVLEGLGELVSRFQADLEGDILSGAPGDA